MGRPWEVRTSLRICQAGCGSPCWRQNDVQMTSGPLAFWKGEQGHDLRFWTQTSSPSHAFSVLSFAFWTAESLSSAFLMPSSGCVPPWEPELPTPWNLLEPPGLSGRSD